MQKSLYKQPCLYGLHFQHCRAACLHDLGLIWWARQCLLYAHMFLAHGISVLAWVSTRIFIQLCCLSWKYLGCWWAWTLPFVVPSGCWWLLIFSIVYTEWASVVETLWVCIQEILGSDLGHIIHYSGWGCFGFPQSCQAVIRYYLN